MRHTFASGVAGTYHVYVGSSGRSLNDISGTVSTGKTEQLPLFRLPHTTSFGGDSSDYRIQLGPYTLKKNGTYSLTASWQEGGSAKLSVVQVDEAGQRTGESKSYTITSGVATAITVPVDGYYFTEIPAGMTHTDFRYQLGHQGEALPDMQTALTGGKVTINNVELMHYSGGAPYLHDTITNTTGRGIKEYHWGMMAFDKDGKPLKLQWNPFGSGRKAHYFLYDWGERDIPPRRHGRRHWRVVAGRRGETGERHRFAGIRHLLFQADYL